MHYHPPSTVLYIRKGIYLAWARPTALLPRSYTLYHLRKKESPKMAKGPTGSGKSIPMKELMQEPWISKV